MNPRIHMIRDNILTGETSPVGNVIPEYIGQEFITAEGEFYKAIGLNNTNWLHIEELSKVDFSIYATKDEVNKEVADVSNLLNETRLELEDTVTKVSDLNSELNISNNIKYATVNGVKEFECKSGYVDNVKIEGKTLVNLVEKYEYKESGDNTAFVMFFGNESGLNYNRISNGDFTFTNHCNLDLVFEVADIGSYANYSQIIVSPNSSKVVNIPDNRRVYSFLGSKEQFETLDNFKATAIGSAISGSHSNELIAYFEGLKSIGQGDKIEVLSSGENLFNKSDFIVGSTDSVVGDKFTHKPSATNRITHNNPIPVEMYEFLEFKYNKDISTVIYELDKDDVILARYMWAKHPFIRAITPNTKYIRVIFAYDNGKNMSLNDYEHVRPILTRCYENREIPATIRSTPSGAKDEIIKNGDKYYKLKRCEEVVLTNKNNWTDGGGSNQTNVKCFRCTDTSVSNAKVASSTRPRQHCNSFLVKLNTSADNAIGFQSNTEGIIITNSGENIYCYIRILHNKLSSVDVDSFKNWIKDNPVTVVYELVEPQMIELPNFNPRTFAPSTTLLIDSGMVQADATFEISNSLGSSLDVMAQQINSNFQSVSNGKTLIASAITDMEVPTLASDTFATMADNIHKIATGSKIETYESTSSSASRTFAYNSGSTYGANFISCKPSFKPSMIIVVCTSSNYGCGIMTPYKPNNATVHEFPYYMFTINTSTASYYSGTSCYSARCDSRVFDASGTIYLPVFNYSYTYKIICIE